MRRAADRDVSYPFYKGGLLFPSVLRSLRGKLSKKAISCCTYKEARLITGELHGSDQNQVGVGIGFGFVMSDPLIGHLI